MDIKADVEPFKYPRNLVEKVQRLAREVAGRNKVLAFDLSSSSKVEVTMGKANQISNTS